MASLTVASVNTKVAVAGGFVRRKEPRAPEVVLAADGGVLSPVVTERSHRNVYEVRSPPLLATDAAAVLAVLTSGVSLTVSGTIFSTGFSAYAGDIKQDWTEGGLYRVIGFSLFESAT